MALSFFRALNPTSRTSGITYCLAKNYFCQGKEMLDYTVSEQIHRAVTSELTFGASVIATFNILVGEHFDIYLKGKYDNQGGAKGVLDFLILPLIARKLIADTYLDERKETYLTNALAWTIALPIEIVRFSAGTALTLLLLPQIALVQLINACLHLPETACRFIL